MIPRTLFDADLEGFRDSVRKFLEQEAAPYHDQWEKDGQVSRELWKKAGELGFLCPMLPEEYGDFGNIWHADVQAFVPLVLHRLPNGLYVNGSEECIQQ